MRSHSNMAPWVLVAAIAVATFFGSLRRSDVYAQRVGYVERASNGAFANQLAPSPITGMCLQPDVNNRAVWGPCGSLPAGTTPGQVLTVKTGTVSTTTTNTATATASATLWTAGNGTLYAGSNVALSKGTDATTSSAVDLADSPKIHATGLVKGDGTLSGTTDYLPKKTATGWGDSSFHEPNEYSSETSKAFRVTGSNPLFTSGAGLFFYYIASPSLGGFVSAYDFGSGERKPLTVRGSTATLYGETAAGIRVGMNTIWFPTTGVVDGACLKGTSSGTTWGDCSSAANSYMVRPYTGQSPGFLEDVTTSSDSSIVRAEYSGKLDLRANFGTGSGTVCQGNDSRLSNARAPTSHASTHLTGGGDAISQATNSSDGLMPANDHAAIAARSATPGASIIPVSNSSGKLTAWIDAASASTAGTMSTAHYNLVAGASATPGAGVLAKGDASGELTSWVKAFKGSGSASCGSGDSFTVGSSWTQVASIDCTLPSAGTVFARAIVRYEVETSSFHYVGARLTLDGSAVPGSDIIKKSARQVGGSYDYDGTETSGLIAIADTGTHSCGVEMIALLSSPPYDHVVCSDSNQGVSIQILKMYK